MALITLSREEGSLSKQVGMALAEKLGYEFLSGKIINEELSKNYGITRNQVEKFDEKKPGFMANFTNSYDKYNNTLKLCILEKLIKNPNCIVMGRSGTFFLKDVPGLLRLRTISSEDVKVKRIMERYKVDEHAAKKMIAHKELERTEQAKFLYGETWGKPSNYDLVVNTDKLSVNSICNMVEGLLSDLNKDNCKEAQAKKLNELFLAQKAINTVLYENKISATFLEVIIEGNKALIKGVTKSAGDIDKISDIVKTVTGAEAVENELALENFSMSYDMGMEFKK